jgi:uncharacterized protein (TIGR04255 family)
VYDLVVDLVVAEGALALSDREVYPNAPLRLVTAEYRFPLSPVLTGGDVLSLLARTLGSTLPIIEPAEALLHMSFGRNPASPSVSGSGYRLLTRDRMTAVTVTSSRLAVETTRYRHWEDFREGYVAVALRALGDEFGALAGLERVGLRFINEIRVPFTSTAAEWHAYVSPDLLAASRVATRGELKTVQGALHLQMTDDTELLMRTGILDGHLVDDSGPLTLPAPPQDGPFFLIDIDSFWTKSGPLAEWSMDAALEISDGLHAPIDDLFENCITEVLRSSVLRKEP